jgi:NAD(P)-dependent dehydrogenase (short-subunit alcohol dehydrogenase family)
MTVEHVNQGVHMPLAVVTGASRGLGLSIARALAARGWELILDARNAEALGAAAPPNAVVVAGDVTDARHREALVQAVGPRPLDLFVSNASELGPSPLPILRHYPLAALRRVYDVNVFAPLALVQQLLPAMRAGTIVAISSDAAVQAYPGWGGYGSAKAAFDQLAAVLAVEEPHVRVVSFDPGDMRTDMQQAAFPGEDISDRPLPDTVVPAFLRLLDQPSGRYRAADLLERERT